MKLDESNVTQVMVPLVGWLKAVADNARPEPNDDTVVGQVLSDLYTLTHRTEYDDEHRIDVLEALVMSLATWIYREKQAEFDKFVSESAEIVVLDTLIKMRDSA